MDLAFLNIFLSLLYFRLIYYDEFHQIFPNNFLIGECLVPDAFLSEEPSELPQGDLQELSTRDVILLILEECLLHTYAKLFLPN